MKAKHTVLTHFSGRLEKRVVDIWGVGIDESVCDSTLLAFDFMTLPINTKKLKRIATLMQPIHSLFAQLYPQTEDK